MEIFNVVKNLGRGTFGTAFLCERKHNQQKIVVKEIYIDSKTEFYSICKNEVSVLKILKHPNIVQYYDSFAKNGCFYIVMEYAKGGSLYDFIINYPGIYIEFNLVLCLFCQVLLAIEYMHEKDIAHRDLKSENIFLTGAQCNVIKLGDFGISKKLKSSGKTYTTIGTTNYFAPEICDGKPYDLKCDVWSLGCILYELCARKRLYEGCISKVLAAIKSGARNLVCHEQYGAETQSVVDACLQINPEDRPSSRQLITYPPLFPHIKSAMVNLGSIF